MEGCLAVSALSYAFPPILSNGKGFLPLILPFSQKMLEGSRGEKQKARRGRNPPAADRFDGIQALAFLAISTSWAKAASLFTASSASIFRLISTPAAFRPCMKVE